MIANDFKIWKISDLNIKYLKNLYVESVVYDSKLIIKLTSGEYVITLSFEGFVSYRINDESYLLKYWKILDSTDRNGYYFYKIENSSYFRDLKNLSLDFFTDGGENVYTHYAIFTLNECIEIISDISPRIEIREK